MEIVTGYYDTLDWLLEHLKSTYNITVDDPKSDLDSSGLDSIEKISICSDLCDYVGKTIDPNVLLDCENYEELVSTALNVNVKANMGRSESLVNKNNNLPNNKQQHKYAKFINPYLANRMSKVRLDKQFLTGKNCYLFDEEGIQYLDFMSQYGALPFGHNPDSIWKTLLDIRSNNEPNFVQPSLLDAAGQLAERLLFHSPDHLKYVTFTNSGAESVEAAIKIARSATGKSAILSTYGGFHGKTMGALSTSGKEDYQQPFNLDLNDFDKIPFGDIKALIHQLENESNRYAAFIIEPIQGEAGVIVPPESYLKKVQEVCHQFGVLFILDEVQTGIGRVGDIFMATALGLSPDILLTAKALGGGLIPIGAVISGDAFTEKFALKHSSTFAGNTIAARVGLATLSSLEEDNSRLLKEVKLNGHYLLDQLEVCKKRYPQIIKEVRGQGYLIGVELKASEEWGCFNFIAVASKVNELAQIFAGYMLNVERVRVVPTLNCGNVIRIEPPLIADKDDCDKFLSAFERTTALFSTANTGVIYQSILDGNKRPFEISRTFLDKYIPANFEIDTKFAFLIHPLGNESYRQFDTSLECLSTEELSDFAETMDGLVDVYCASETVIQSSKSIAKADFILVNYSAQSLKNMPRKDAVAIIKEAVLLAKKRGNQLVGLGAYTSIISDAGFSLADENIPITSGNSYTVVSALESLSVVMDKFSYNYSESCVAVVGAAGSIGRALSILIAEKVNCVVLVGNPSRGYQSNRDKLLKVAAEICRHLCKEIHFGHVFPRRTIGDCLRTLPIELPTSYDDIETFVPLAEMLEKNYTSFVITADPLDLKNADIVMTATSFPGSSFDYNNLKLNSIVCDVSRPRSISSDIKYSRPDVLVIDGGVVEVPGTPDLTAYGLPHGCSYACMAETMILALDGKFKSAPLGPTLDLDYIKKIQQLGEEHGFKTSRVQSFGEILNFEECLPLCN